jgi:hypothetical protein
LERGGSNGSAILHLGAGGFEPVWRGDEEDELAPSDRRREGGGVEEVGLEQQQPLRRAGDQPPQQTGLLLVLCRHAVTKMNRVRVSDDDQNKERKEGARAPVFRSVAWTV